MEIDFIASVSIWSDCTGSVNRATHLIQKLMLKLSNSHQFYQCHIRSSPVKEEDKDNVVVKIIKSYFIYKHKLLSFVVLQVELLVVLQFVFCLLSCLLSLQSSTVCPNRKYHSGGTTPTPLSCITSLHNRASSPKYRD